MTDRSTCPAVERKPGKVSGAWVFTGTRIPLSALCETLADGATVEEFVDYDQEDPGVQAVRRQVLSYLVVENTHEPKISG